MTSALVFLLSHDRCRKYGRARANPVLPSAPRSAAGACGMVQHSTSLTRHFIATVVPVGTADKGTLAAFFSERRRRTRFVWDGSCLSPLGSHAPAKQTPEGGSPAKARVILLLGLGLPGKVDTHLPRLRQTHLVVVCVGNVEEPLRTLVWDARADELCQRHPACRPKPSRGAPNTATRAPDRGKPRRSCSLTCVARAGAPS